MFGNYANYYGYRSKDSVIDVRLKHLNPDYFTDKDVLDIGCNAGAVTLDVTLLYMPKSATGIDIDPSLVRKANQTLYLRASYLKPLHQRPLDDAMEVSETEEPTPAHSPPSHFPLDYFPLSCTREIGVLPYTDTLPITFRCSDFIQEPLNPLVKYDTILALSITKWIHLNYADAGIKLFFTKCHQSLRKGGLLIVEPQEWDTYKKKLSKELSEVYKGLTLKPEDFEGLLVATGFKCVQRIDADEGFKRAIYVYQRV